MKLRLAPILLVLFVMLPLVAAGDDQMPLMASQTIAAGVVSIEEVADAVIIRVMPDLASGWRLKKVHVYFDESMLPLTRSGNPKVGQFPYRMAFPEPVEEPWVVVVEQCPVTSIESAMRVVAVHADLVLLNAEGEVDSVVGAWAQDELNATAFEGPRWGWWNEYELSCVDGD